MNDVLGGPAGAYLGLIVVLTGGAAFLTGQAVAASWKSVWQVVLYGILLAMAGRFLLFALFDGDLLAFPGFALDCTLTIAIALFAWRVTHVRKMLAQYPWLYRRAGLFTYGRADMSKQP